MDEDPFDGVLGLEDTFYDEGYKLGEADGKRAGHVEGRLFGLEKGFEKFVEMGRLHGRSIVWASRHPHMREQHPHITPFEHGPNVEETDPRPKSTATADRLLPCLPDNLRLERHLRTFHALVELESLSTQNAEDGVAEFDDRLKRANGKAKIIEKSIGEESEGEPIEDGAPRPIAPASSKNQGEGSIEDISILQARH